jgi:hypothetical protein
MDATMLTASGTLIMHPLLLALRILNALSNSDHFFTTIFFSCITHAQKNTHTHEVIINPQ